MAYSGRPGGLSELARYGFVALSETLAKLDQLVSLVGDSGRAALAVLGQSQDPDQALNYLLSLAEDQPAAVKKLLKNEESAKRLCLLLGASSALADFIRRTPGSLSRFEAATKLPGDFKSYRDQISKAVVSVDSKEH